MNNHPGLYVALLIAWITQGALMYEDRCCNPIPVKQQVPHRHYFHGIVLKDTGLNIRIPFNFEFYKSTSNYALPLPVELEQALQQTSTFLKNNPSKKLKIVCRYHPDEVERSSSDLGMERARAIEKIYLSKGVRGEQLLKASLRDSALPIRQNKILAGFVPIVIQSP
ncbi:MAG: hypothetical protein K1X68_13930 [Saprospiraceae bacterium]|nr:hypothetical protein [Saprospiraceae bacterium]HMW38885.1 hypothetical protein [Saprospiraceae bacterium]HMX86947.1 hypothetical protein [Saprospiraceae bacterium]HMZ39873.1 hypothetical protein [Saprospiraceae bacterium]HNA65277.1 hypothetical protein [Saprospiraceae bacterium]